MAAAASAPRKSRRPFVPKIVRPDFANERLSNPRGRFTKSPNDEREAMYSCLSGAPLNITMYVERWTRGGCFEDRDTPTGAGECPRPQAIGPRYLRDEHGNVTGIIGVRERMAQDLGFDINTIDKALSPPFAVRTEDLQDGDSPIIEVREYRGFAWLIYHPENLLLLPKREIIPKKPPARAEQATEEDEDDEPQNSLPAVNVSGHSKTKWFNMGGTPVRFDNRGTSGFTGGLEVDDHGIVVVIPEADPEAKQDRSRKVLRLPKTEVAENGQVTKPPPQDTPYFDDLSAASRAAFDALLGVFDRCGKPVPLAKIPLCKRHFCDWGDLTHLRIAADAYVREGTTWDKPQFTPLMWVYLDPKGKQLWDNEPVKPRTSKEGAKPGRGNRGDEAIQAYQRLRRRSPQEGG